MADDDQHQHLTDELAQDARVLLAARRLPVGKLSQEDIEAVASQFRRYTHEHGVFDKQVASEAGLSQSVVSQFRTGSYKGDNDRVARKLNDWMEQHARRRRTALPEGFVTTKIVEEMRTIVATAAQMGSMAAIVTPSGTGKTLLLQVLADKYHGHVVYCDEDMTPVEFYRRVARAIGVTSTRKGGYKSRTQLAEAIVDRLRGTHRPLFLDEAHRLPPAAIPRIRTIHDRTGVPVVMAGAAEILDRINDRSDGRGQFARRCLQYNVLDHVYDAEGPDGGGNQGRSLFTRKEIAQFIEQLGVKFDPDGQELAWAIACLPNHGCLGTLKQVVHLARPDAKRRDKPITRDEVLKALGLLLGTQGRYVGRCAEHHLTRRPPKQRKAAAG